MKDLLLDKKMVLVSLIYYGDDGFENVETIVVEPETDISEIEKHSDKIAHYLHRLSAIKPAYNRERTCLEKGREIVKTIREENANYLEIFQECLSVLKDYPEFLKIANKTKELYNKKGFEFLRVDIIDEIHCSDSEDNNQKYLLYFVGIDSGGGGCGGDCYFDYTPLLLNLNKKDFKFFSTLEPFDVPYEDDEIIIDAIKARNLPQGFIDELFGRDYDGCGLIEDKIEFFLKKF